MNQSNPSDPLTGLPGNQPFEEQVDKLIADSTGTEREFSLAILDIDLLEALNTTHGMAAGDEVLKLISGELKRMVKNRGSVYRIKADEFNILLADTEKEEAFLILEQFRKTMEPQHEFSVEGRPVKIGFTVSIGLASCPADSMVKYELVRKVKDALFRAKVKGKNRICLAREEKMVTKTAHYTQGQLDRLTKTARANKINEAVLLREALDDLLKKYDVN